MKNKCKQCNEYIIKIKTAGGTVVCNAGGVLYWLAKYPDASILKPNGETIFCTLQGDPETAHGIGYTLHTCYEEGADNEK